MAPFMILGCRLGTRLCLAHLRLFVQPSACTFCHRCTQGCSMSLEVEEMVAQAKAERSECILCGECADRSPRGAIHLRFSQPRANNTTES